MKTPIQRLAGHLTALALLAGGLLGSASQRAPAQLIPLASDANAA